MKERIDKLNFFKIENFCSVKITVKVMKRQATEWEKIVVKDTSCQDKVATFKLLTCATGVIYFGMQCEVQTLVFNGCVVFQASILKIIP